MAWRHNATGNLGQLREQFKIFMRKWQFEFLIVLDGCFFRRDNGSLCHAILYKLSKGRITIFVLTREFKYGCQKATSFQDKEVNIFIFRMNTKIVTVDKNNNFMSSLVYFFCLLIFWMKNQGTPN